MKKCQHCSSIIDETWPSGLLVIRRDSDSDTESWCWYAGGDEEADGENKLYEAKGVFEIFRVWVTGDPCRKLELDLKKNGGL